MYIQPHLQKPLLYSQQRDAVVLPQASKYLRLHPIETRIYSTNNGLWIASVPLASVGMTEIVCRGNDEIMCLIFQGVLVPDIVSAKEYRVQHAVGSVDHRTYRLQSKIAAKYQFSYDTSMTLTMIENLMELCDYNIFDDGRGLRVDGQKYLEIIPENGTVVCDYQGNIIKSSKSIHYIDQSSFADMISRGIIILRGTKWKLSRNYWEIKL